MATVYVQFSDETETVVVSVFSGPQDTFYFPFQGELEDDDPRYIAYIDPGSTPAGKAQAARIQRDSLLRTICDPGILMAQRALRMATDPVEIAYIEGKIQELDIYAAALQDIPEQPDFPQTVIWPVAPVR